MVERFSQLTFEVGQPYCPGRINWQETCEFSWRGGQLELLLVWEQPTPAEIEGVARAPMWVGFKIEGPLIFFLVRFEGVSSWADAPYSFHLVPIEERSSPPERLSPETRAVVTVLLIEAQSGIVQAIRVVTLSPAFTRRLFDAIRQQAQQPFDVGFYDAALAAIYEHSSSEELARQAELIEIVGV